MNEFEEFVRSQGFSGDFQRGCNGQYKSDLLHFMEKAFMHQKAKIDELQKQINKVNTQLEIWRNWCDINENHNAHEFVFECADELEKALRCE